MSRSYKKVPGHVDRSPFHKRQANVTVRRYKGDVQDGCWYQKLYEHWNICDYKSLYYPMGRRYSHTRKPNPGPFRGCGWHRSGSPDWDDLVKARSK